jgi:hypothetical protein
MGNPDAHETGVGYLALDELRGALACQPVPHLYVADHGRAGALGDRHRVADMIGMSMCQQDDLGLHIGGAGGGKWIAGQERIGQHRVPVDVQRENRMPKPGKRNAHITLLLKIADYSL